LPVGDRHLALSGGLVAYWLDGSGRDLGGAGTQFGYDWPGSARLANDGTNLWAVAQFGRGDEDIYAWRLRPTGELLDDARGIAVATSDAEFAPRIACTSAVCLVVWTHRVRVGQDVEDSIYGARLSPAGENLDPSGIAISSQSKQDWFPSVATDGEGFLAVWPRLHEGGVHGARVDAAGAVLDRQPILIHPGLIHGVAVAFDGASYLVVWQDEDRWELKAGEIYGCRVSPAGAVLDPSPIAIATGAAKQEGPAVAADGKNALVLWSEGGVYGYSDLRGARVSRDGNVLDRPGFLVAYSANAQARAAAASDGKGAVVVWEDDRTATQEPGVYAARVDAEGLQGKARSIAEGGSWRSLALAAGGGGYLVAGEVRRQQGDQLAATLEAVRLDAAGVPLDQMPIRLSAPPDHVGKLAVASDGDAYLVLWDQGQASIRGARVSAAGRLLDAAPFLVAQGKRTDEPAAAFDGSNYLVVWSAPWDTQTSSAIRAARVSRDGEVLDRPGLTICSGEELKWAVDVAFDGANHLVVWADRRNLKSAERDEDIFAARVSPAGAVLDPCGFPVSVAPSDERWPAVSFDGVASLVVWEDWRARAPSAPGSQLYGSFVTPEGGVLSPDGMPIATAFSVGRHGAALAAVGKGRTLVAYHQLHPEPPLGANRIDGRFVERDEHAAALTRGCSHGLGDPTSGWAPAPLVLLLLVGVALIRRRPPGRARPRRRRPPRAPRSGRAAPRARRAGSARARGGRSCRPGRRSPGARGSPARPRRPRPRTRGRSRAR
jgi:hypothetical protein